MSAHWFSGKGRCAFSGEIRVCRGLVTCYGGQSMYTIKQASLRSGVSVPLLRQWKRRYDVVHPARTDSGFSRGGW